MDHKHTCPVCGFVWVCIDDDCSVPDGYECEDCWAEYLEQTRREYYPRD